MTITVVERVALAVQAQLETIEAGTVNAAGYTYQTKPRQVIRPARFDRVLYEDFDIAIKQETRERDEENSADGNPPSVAWRHQFRIRCIRTPDDFSTVPIDSLINIFQADVEAALMEDPNWGGLAINTEIMGAESVLSDQAVEVGVDVIVHITYAHSENDPTVLRS